MSGQQNGLQRNKRKTSYDKSQNSGSCSADYGNLGRERARQPSAAGHISTLVIGGGHVVLPPRSMRHIASYARPLTPTESFCDAASKICWQTTVSCTLSWYSHTSLPRPDADTLQPSIKAMHWILVSSHTQCQLKVLAGTKYFTIQKTKYKVVWSVKWRARQTQLCFKLWPLLCLYIWVKIQVAERAAIRRHSKNRLHRVLIWSMPL